MIDQFDIHALRAGRAGRARDLVLALQHRLASDLETCVVAPLAPLGRVPPILRLRPVVAVEEQRFVLVIDRLAAVERRTVGPRVASASAWRDEIIAALDFLFTGI